MSLQSDDRKIQIGPPILIKIHGPKGEITLTPGWVFSFTFDLFANYRDDE